MSIECISLVWKDDYYKEKDKTKLLVSLAIADCANGDFEAYPGVEYLARKARCSARSVQEACREMEADGKLEIMEGKGVSGTNRYRMIFGRKGGETISPGGVKRSGAGFHPNRKEPSDGMYQGSNVQQAAEEDSKVDGKKETTSRPIETNRGDKTPNSADPLLLDAPPRRFSPPRQDEVADFFKASGLNGESARQAEAFINHHAARGWMLGRVKMKDWRAAARTWKMNFERFSAPSSSVVASAQKTAAERQAEEKAKRDQYQRELEARLMSQGGAK